MELGISVLTLDNFFWISSVEGLLHVVSSVVLFIIFFPSLPFPPSLPPSLPPFPPFPSQVFFVVMLQPPSIACSSPLPNTTDPDQFINCDLMDGRDAFLTLAREKHWEFSSLSRAKFSTMAMLFELHNQGGERFVYTCNHCRLHVETRYHCRECDVSLGGFEFWFGFVFVLFVCFLVCVSFVYECTCMCM